MKNVILYDLGNTLIKYFEKSEFPIILRQAITEVYNHLLENGYPEMPSDKIWERVKQEDHEAKDNSTRPLEDRLINIFQLEDINNDTIMDLCRCFMKPIFERSFLYEDTLPVLIEMKERGFKSAIISNTTWGSPGNLWREEIHRFKLNEYVDEAVFCRDVGWRKPARQIFDFTLCKLKAIPEQCIFVGDDPRWDILGPRSVGIDAILIDRNGAKQNMGEKPIRSLYELYDRIIILK